MVRSSLVVLFWLAPLLVLGCGPGKSVGIETRGPSWTLSSDDPIPGIHSGTLSIFTMKYGPPTGVTVALWSDLSGSSSHGSAGAGGAAIDGTFEPSHGTGINYHCETADGIVAKVTIAGTAYTSDQGALFLISSQSDPPKVKQLSADVTSLPGEAAAIKDYAMTHLEILDFFSGSKDVESAVVEQ